MGEHQPMKWNLLSNVATAKHRFQRGINISPRNMRWSHWISLLTLSLLMNATSGVVHDVTMVLPRLIFPVQRPSMIRCVAEEKFELDIEIEANVGNGEEIPEDAIIGNIEPEGWPGIQMEIPKSAGAKRFGAFRCSARDNETDITRKAVGIVLPTSAQVFPMQSTYRTIADVPLEMEVLQPRPKDYEELMWVQMSPGRPRHLTSGELVTTVDKPDPDQSGIYVITFPIRDFNRRLYQQSLLRLIVRACPNDRFGPICEEECMDCKNGGMCDMDDGTCVCPAGFGGPTCEKICGANTFGPDCQYQCDEDAETSCKGKIFCRPDPLGCTCAAGYSGVVCNAKCLPGFYGSNCESECHCLKADCDHITGKCIDGGCASGWTGENCQNRCPPFSYGPDCKINCGACYGDLSCNGTSGECPGARVIDVDEGSAFYSVETEHVQLDENEETVFYCEFGYASPICDESCENGTWWRDCVRECHCMAGAACNPINGVCISSDADDTVGSCAAGWKGKSCDQRCDSGMYGIGCEETCGNCIDGNLCDSETGKCDQPGPEGELCLNGFMPPLCQEMCPEGTFGVNCSFQCRCHNTTSCNAADGGCEDSCAAGYDGPGCQNRCVEGTYGLRCAGECGKCLKNVPCNYFNGSCPYGCMLGWAGDTCHNDTLCDEYQCQNNATCEQEESVYRCHCPIGYAGGHCEKKLPPCQSMPCQNQGMCMDVDEDNYVCQCFFSYSGKNCEVHLDGMLRNDSRALHAVIGALAAIALLLALGGILAYKCRPDEEDVSAMKMAGDCEAGYRGGLPDVNKPTMHRRREGSIKLPRRFRGKAHPKTVTMKAGNKKIRVSRKMLGKSSLFSDGSSCHLSRMTTNSLFNFYEQPKAGDKKRGFLKQCNQEPPGLSNKHKMAGFHHNLSTNYPNVTQNEWLEQDFRWGGISRGKHLQDSPHPLRNNTRRRALNNINMPVGVPLSDFRSLITQARDADEEFEMEVRRDRKHEPGSKSATAKISGNEYQRKADRARRRSRTRPKGNKHKPPVAKIKEEKDHPSTSFRMASPFPSRNRVGHGTLPNSKTRDRHRDPRLSQSLNTKARYRKSLPNVLSTVDDGANNRAPRKSSNRKNSHRKSHTGRHGRNKEYGFDDDYD